MRSTAPPATNTMDLTLMLKVQQKPHSQTLRVRTAWPGNELEQNHTWPGNEGNMGMRLG